MHLDKIDWGSGLVFARMFHETVSFPTGDVTIALGLTRDGNNLQLTVRVLDKGDDEVGVFERTVIDTPGVDPTVDHVPGLTILRPDPGPPYFQGGGAYLHLDQITDGNQPRAEVIYDNFCYETYTTVSLRIERQADESMQITWPVLPPTLILQQGPAVDGPWTDVADYTTGTTENTYTVLPGEGTEAVALFRLIEPGAP